MSSRLVLHAIWRDEVFKESLHHEFLLHGMLATAALHKASTYREFSDEFRKYANAGLIHQNAALQEYSPLMTNPTAKNAAALFALSMLLTLITFSVERLPDDLKSAGSLLTPADPSPDILLPPGSPTRNFMMVISTLRGILLVIRQTSQYLQGDIAEFIRHPKTEDLPPHTQDLQELYKQLAITAANYRPMHNKMNLPQADLPAMLEAQVVRLRDITRCRSVIEWDTHIFSFLVGAPPEYINCIKQGEPLALVILAHWAACFRCMDHLWWATGWGEQLVVDIAKLIDMNTWSRAMEWPLLQVGRTLDNLPVQVWS